MDAIKLSLGDIEHFGHVNVGEFQAQGSVTVFCGLSFIAIGKTAQESIDLDQISNFPADGDCYFLELCCVGAYLQHSLQVNVWPVEDVTD